MACQRLNKFKRLSACERVFLVTFFFFRERKCLFLVRDNITTRKHACPRNAMLRFRCRQEEFTPLAIRNFRTSSRVASNPEMVADALNPSKVVQFTDWCGTRRNYRGSCFSPTFVWSFEFPPSHLQVISETVTASRRICENRIKICGKKSTRRDVAKYRHRAADKRVVKNYMTRFKICS